MEYELYNPSDPYTFIAADKEVAALAVEDHDVMPDEMESLKLCCHNCKIDCLLKKYNELKEKYDHEHGSVEEHGEL